MEIKFLEISFEEIVTKLALLNAKKVFDDTRTITYYKGNDSLEPFLKLTEEGDKLKLTSKDKNGKEVKLFVSRKEECDVLLSTLGYLPISQVKAKRISYELGSTDLDIDFFPEIPPFMEVDLGDTPAYTLDELTKLLGLDGSEKVELSTPQILNRYGKDYFKVYAL